MYENQDEIEALARQASKRLKEQAAFSDENEVEDIYADFRDESNSDRQNGSSEHEDKTIENEDIYYGPLPTLEKEGGNNSVPTLDPFDEPLFPGGPGKTQIQAWKKEWDGYDIYVTEVLNDTFIFRTLNRFEYKQLITYQNLDALQREETICKTVTLWPLNYDWQEMATTKAGIPSTYADIIMEKSGFTKDYAIQVI